MNKIILTLTTILLSFNIYSQSFDFNKEYKCEGKLYLLSDNENNTEGTLNFDLILNNGFLTIRENNSKYMSLDYKIKFLKGEIGFIVTPKSEKYSITFTVDLEKGKYKYHYAQSQNDIYNNVISLGECK